MIEVILQFASEVVLVKIQGNNVTFGNTVYGAQMASIHGLKLDKNGVIKEFPELKDSPNWRQEAIAKFIDKIKELNNEKKIAHYVIEDLRKFGYKPKYLQESGKRREILQ